MTLNSQIEQLCGLRCQDIRLIVGGTLILYVGDKLGESPLTEWRLHVEPAWRLETPARGIVGSLDTPVEREEAESALVSFRELIGRSVAAIRVGAPVLDLEIAFDDGSKLRTFAHSSDGENWELRHRSGRRLGMRAITEWAQWRDESDEAH